MVDVIQTTPVSNARISLKAKKKNDREAFLECLELVSPRKFSQVTATPEPLCLLDGPSLGLLKARLLLFFRFHPRACPQDDNFRRKQSCDDTGQGNLEAGWQEVKCSLRRQGMKSGCSDTQRDRGVQNHLATHTHTVTLTEWGMKWNIYSRQMRTVNLFNLAKLEEIILTLSGT